MFKILQKIASFISNFGRRSKGSILLEIAIGLSVLGVISGFLISKTITVNKSIRVQLTKNNIGYVKTALTAYIANNNRLPKPSCSNNGYECSSEIFVGSVPFRVLGIAEKYTFDGNGKKLIYIVEPGLTTTKSSIYESDITSDYFCKSIIPSIAIEGISLSPTDTIAFVIDTRNPRISENNIIISPSTYTTWISRDMILMHYFKNSPCKRETPSTSYGINHDGML